MHLQNWWYIIMHTMTTVITWWLAKAQSRGLGACKVSGSAYGSSWSPKLPGRLCSVVCCGVETSIRIRNWWFAIAPCSYLTRIYLLLYRKWHQRRKCWFNCLLRNAKIALWSHRNGHNMLWKRWKDYIPKIAVVVSKMTCNGRNALFLQIKFQTPCSRQSFLFPSCL